MMGVGSDLRKAIYKQTKEIAIAMGELPCTRTESGGRRISEELYFNNELRKCLNVAGLSDCGENDAWNYWYQRVHKAHDQAVDRVTETQRAENAKLREMVRSVLVLRHDRVYKWLDTTFTEVFGKSFTEQAHELGVEENG